MHVFLTTDRMLLREFDWTDVGNLYELDSDPRVMRYLTGERTPRTTIEREVIPRILDEYERGPVGRWAAIERSTKKFVGWFALTPSSPDLLTNVELGYRLCASVWNQGYATEGTQALIEKAFSDLGVVRIWGQTMAVNIASRRVMEKAGLIHFRTTHPHFDDPLPGTEYGEVEYEIWHTDGAS